MVDFTVAICTYNGANRLPDVFEALQQQTGTEQIRWEIIVVDNNSTDDTREVIQNYQRQWSTNQPFQYLFETNQGAAFARIRAVKAAKGQFIGFLDDDNIPAPNWIAAAYKFGSDHPQVGAYGSQIHGDYEVEPSEDLKKVAFFLAVIERGAHPQKYDRRKGMLPPSAGLVVRRQAWCDNVPDRPFLSGRTATWLPSGEDLEALAYIQRAGWEIWYNPAMEVHHKIPHWRMERDSMLKLVLGAGLARHHIRMVRTPAWLRPILLPVYFANDTRKVLRHYLQHHKQLKTSVAAACEMEFLRGTLLSPFYLSRKYFSKR
jgi:glycosyltransferase involved in cell wall biosynthesis